MQTTLFGTVVRVLFSWLGFELILLCDVTGRGGGGAHTLISQWCYLTDHWIRGSATAIWVQFVDACYSRYALGNCRLCSGKALQAGRVSESMFWVLERLVTVGRGSTTAIRVFGRLVKAGRSLSTAVHVPWRLVKADKTTCSKIFCLDCE